MRFRSEMFRFRARRSENFEAYTEYLLRNFRKAAAEIWTLQQKWHSVTAPIGGMTKRKGRSASLEHIFGSRVRVRLLKLFLEHPDDKFYVREITRCTRSHIHSVRRELGNLCR